MDGQTDRQTNSWWSQYPMCRKRQGVKMIETNKFKILNPDILKILYHKCKSSIHAQSDVQKYCLIYPCTTLIVYDLSSGNWKIQEGIIWPQKVCHSQQPSHIKVSIMCTSMSNIKALTETVHELQPRKVKSEMTSFDPRK